VKPKRTGAQVTTLRRFVAPSLLFAHINRTVAGIRHVTFYFQSTTLTFTPPWSTCMTCDTPNYVLHSATYKQAMELRPNLAVLPWGATEAHGYHLPYGTDVEEAAALGERAVARANESGCRCVLLPAVPFGANHTQLYQVATINMRARTQHAVLDDVADSLVRQGIDRLVLLNFHGGNEFKPMIRDVMLGHPIFIVQVSGWNLADVSDLLTDPGGDHANEFETSIMLHLRPHWVRMADAGEGRATPSRLPALSSTPGVWAPRDWRSATEDTGLGDPRSATAEKGMAIMERFVNALAPVLVELAGARAGDFPFVIS